MCVWPPCPSFSGLEAEATSFVPNGRQRTTDRGTGFSSTVAPGCAVPPLVPPLPEKTLAAGLPRRVGAETRKVRASPESSARVPSAAGESSQQTGVSSPATRTRGISGNSHSLRDVRHGFVLRDVCEDSASRLPSSARGFRNAPRATGNTPSRDKTNAHSAWRNV